MLIPMAGRCSAHIQALAGMRSWGWGEFRGGLGGGLGKRADRRAKNQNVRELLNRVPGFTCDFPHTSEDRVRHSGYPDLRLVDAATNRVFYLDPKLYAAGSRDGSFRTFYFEPKITTNKVRDDAAHLLVGFEHTPRTAGHWTFIHWDLVDVAHFKVRLKAEFQGSNREIYRPEAIIATSGNEASK